MKELSIEEKAKAYDESLERARIWKDKSGMPKDKQSILDDIFPELKESDDERIRKEIISHVQYLVDYYNDSMPNYGKWIAWLEKQGEQQHSWSEEDDIMVHDIDYALRCQITYSKSRLSSMSSWICELKNRIQPKHEWSEEDEYKIKSLINVLNDVVTLEVAPYTAVVEPLILWLKSLRPQPQWKPSDEQMEALEHFIVHHNGSTNYAKDLEKLRLQLKKLREE